MLASSNSGGGQFVIAILAYYVILYFVRKYFISHIPLVMGVVGIISLLVYIFFFPYKYEVSSKGMYGISTLYRWIPYFGFMLLGAWMGLRRERIKSKPFFDAVIFVLSLALFYGIQFAAKMDGKIAPFQIVTLIPLMGVIYYFYKLCKIGWLSKIYTSRYGHSVIMTVSGLCLESYLVQFGIITDKLNIIFPLNIPIVMSLVLAVAYVCKVLSRLFTQTFKNAPYDWGEMVKAY